jgi:hypothetical protein
MEGSAGEHDEAFGNMHEVFRDGYLRELEDTVAGFWKDRLRVAGVALGKREAMQTALVVLSDTRGHPTVLVKLGGETSSAPLVDNERHALCWLETCTPSIAAATPKLLSYGRQGSLVWLALDVVGGSATRIPRRERAALDTKRRAFVRSLWRGRSQTVPLKLTEPFASIAMLRDLTFDDEFLAMAYQDLMSLSDGLVPAAMAHGDFTPWNTFDVGGALGVVDWEGYMPQAPAAFDAFWYAYASARRLGGADPREASGSFNELLRDAAEDVLGGLSLEAAEHLQQILTALVPLAYEIDPFRKLLIARAQQR